MKQFTITSQRKGKKSNAVRTMGVVEAKSQSHALTIYGCNNGKQRVYTTKRGNVLRAVAA